MCLCPQQKFLLRDFPVASSSFENCEIFTAVNLKCKLAARHAETKQRAGSNQKSACYYDAIANHRIGIANNRSFRLGKDTKVAKKKLKKTNNLFCFLSSILNLRARTKYRSKKKVPPGENCAPNESNQPGAVGDLR